MTELAHTKLETTLHDYSQWNSGVSLNERYGSVSVATALDVQHSTDQTRHNTEAGRGEADSRRWPNHTRCPLSAHSPVDAMQVDVNTDGV